MGLYSFPFWVAICSVLLLLLLLLSSFYRPNSFLNRFYILPDDQGLLCHLVQCALETLVLLFEVGSAQCDLVLFEPSGLSRTTGGLVILYSLLPVVHVFVFIWDEGLEEKQANV